MSSSAAHAPSAPKSALYVAHVRTELPPALHELEGAIARLEVDIADYQDAARRIHALIATSPVQSGNVSGSGGMHETMVELGAGVFVDAQIPRSSLITLDIGFDIHLDLPPEEAAACAQRRAEILQKRIGILESRRERVQWEIAQFEGAAQEAEPSVSVGVS